MTRSRGLPEPDGRHGGDQAIEYAGGNASGTLVGIGKCVGSLDENRRAMHEVAGHPEALTLYHEGWFQETVRRDAASFGPIALLRLGGDWYESTRVCLEHLLPLVIPGGFLVIDDHGEWLGCKVAVNEHIAALSPPFRPTRGSPSPGVSTSPYAFKHATRLREVEDLIARVAEANRRVCARWLRGFVRRTGLTL